MNDILPCPFCGGTEQRVKSSGRWGWFVSCSCCAVGPSAGSRDEAIVAWNCRNDKAGTIEAERLADENENLRKLLQAMCVRVKAEYPRGGFPDMGIFSDELAYLGIGGANLESK